MLPVRLLPTFRLARQMAREMEGMMAEMRLSPFSRYYPFSRGWFEMTPQQMLNEHLGYMDHIFAKHHPTLVSSAHFRYRKGAPERPVVKKGGEGETEGAPESEHGAAISEEKGNNKFQVSVNLGQFKPENIEVTLDGNRLQIRAKQEENVDGGYETYREFSQQYLLPENIDLEGLTTVLSKEGLLTLEAPMQVVEARPKARQIPIVREEVPAVEEDVNDTKKE